MKVTQTELEGVLLVEPRLFEDARGHFLETFQAERYAASGVAGPFVQDNLVWSERGVLRGLHLQHPHGQGKLVQALRGEIFDVVVDVRQGSPKFGRWVGATLSAKNHLQMFAPAAFAHGYVVVSDGALVSYKATEIYAPDAELGIAWNDPGLGIDWPVDAPRLNDRDAAAPALSEIPASRLPPYPA